MIKKILLGLLACIVVAIVGISVFLYLNKDKIIAEVKTVANEQLVNAKLNFGDVDISLFRQWPKLSVSLSDLEVIGTGKFKDVQLIKTKRLDVGLDLMQAIFGSDAVIESLHLEEPDIHIYALSDGSANYDITKPDTSTTKAATKLERYSISKGKLTYDDRGLDLKMVLDGLEHSGKGNFTDVIFDLNMKTDAKQATLHYGGLRYFYGAHLVYNSVINMDMSKNKYTFSKNELTINALKLMFDGWVALPNETDTQMDLTFASPATDFKSFLSIIPGAYTQDFNAVKAEGSAGFSGKVKGTLNTKLYPTFDIKLNIANGSIKYPELPLGLSGIKLDCQISNPTTNLNGTTVNIPAFALKVGNNPLEGYFKLKTPMTDPDIDTKMKGVIKFDELAKAFPIPGVKSMTGTMLADLFMKARMSQIDQALYDQMQVAGNLRITDMQYQPTTGATTRIQDMQMDFTPQRVLMPNFEAKVGNSDLKANGQIDNILAYYAKDKTMKGRLTLTSTYLSTADFMSTEESKSGHVPDDAPPTEAVFDRWDFDTDMRVGTLVYDTYKINNATLVGHFTPNKMIFSDLSGKIGASDFAGSGTLTNVFNYLYDHQTLHGNLNLKSNYMDMNQFMTDEADAKASAKNGDAPVQEDVIPVPENIDIVLNVDFGKVLYTNHTLTNLNGQVIVNDEKASLKDCTANLLGGLVGLNGMYSTADKAKPVFNVDLALKSFGFKDAYAQIVTVKTLAPIAQFVDGKFNTNLSMSGVLGKDMTPDFKTISAAGLIETFNAVLNNFKITNELGDRLNLDYLKSMDLKNSKNWFEVKDGKLKVEPFDVQVRDTKLTISGQHGLDSDIAYSIKTRTPRKTLEANPVGKVAASGLNYLRGEAAKLGININQGEYVNVLFTIGGTMLSPKISVKILGSDGESTVQDEVKGVAGAVVEKAKDSLTTRANQELNKAKEKANEVVDKVTDSLRNVANRELDKAKDKAVETVKDKVGDAVGREIGDKVGTAVGDKVSEKAGEILGDQGKKTVNDVKDKLNGWDPFKKKKN